METSFTRCAWSLCKYRCQPTVSTTSTYSLIPQPDSQKATSRMSSAPTSIDVKLRREGKFRNPYCSDTYRQSNWNPKGDEKEHEHSKYWWMIPTILEDDWIPRPVPIYLRPWSPIICKEKKGFSTRRPPMYWTLIFYSRFQKFGVRETSPLLSLTLRLTYSRTPHEPYPRWIARAMDYGFWEAKFQFGRWLWGFRLYLEISRN